MMLIQTCLTRTAPLVSVFALGLAFLASCSAGDAACIAGLPCTGDAETPATGKVADIEAWLAKGEYKKWKCESAAHAARGSSPHDKNRICSNAKLSSATLSNIPLGAASVKELYDGNDVKGHAIMVKAKASKGSDSWYWFERSTGGTIVANATNDSTCTGCHAGAPNDSVFTQVK
jgi:hypothetical protein